MFFDGLVLPEARSVLLAVNGALEDWTTQPTGRQKCRPTSGGFGLWARQTYTRNINFEH